MTTKEPLFSKLSFASPATLLMLGLCSTSLFSRNVVSEVIFAQVPDTLIGPVAIADTTAGQGEVFYLVEDMPDFTYMQMQGIVAFRNYVTDNLQWSENMDGIQGRVFVSFIVEVDGRISTIRIVRSLDINCDNEAIRVIAHAPKWIPGMQSGKPVRVAYTIPVTFQLQ